MRVSEYPPRLLGDTLISTYVQAYKRLVGGEGVCKVSEALFGHPVCVYAISQSSAGTKIESLQVLVLLHRVR